MLETFVTMELRRQLGWSTERATLHHFRTRDGAEVDAVLETPDGRVAGIEVKTGATVRTEDFRGLRRLRAAAGEAFVAGVVLHTSEHRFVVCDLMAGRAAIYTRLSKDRLEERSREDQEADCRALCAIKGFTVVTVHTDLESGYRRSARRPGYEALLDDLRAGAVDVVVIWKLDRLTRQGIRQIAPLLDVLEACAATLLSVHDPIDTSSAMGEGVLGMLASMAKQESENMSVRIRR